MICCYALVVALCWVSQGCTTDGLWERPTPTCTNPIIFHWFHLLNLRSRRVKDHFPGCLYAGLNLGSGQVLRFYIYIYTWASIPRRTPIKIYIYKIYNYLKQKVTSKNALDIFDQPLQARSHHLPTKQRRKSSKTKKNNWWNFPKSPSTTAQKVVLE